MFRGLAAIIEAYLIYWALVYFIARKYFKFSREWAAPLASGISICGVSAAITTGAAIRARPIVPIMVSSLVVIFSVFELILLPILAQVFLWREPMVAAAWMGLAVKTDGAAVASGAITDALIRSRAAGAGIHYEAGLAADDDHDRQGLHRRLHRDLGTGPGRGLGLRDREGTRTERCRSPTSCERFPRFVVGYFALFLLLARRGARAARFLERAEGCHGRGRPGPGPLLRHDVFLDRAGVELQTALGRGDRPAGPGLRDQPVRLHHLDRPGDLVAVLPRRAPAAS